jgi:hypothetical protein
MTINELKTQYPALYSSLFNLGVSAERKRVLAAELIANAVMDGHHTVAPLYGSEET